MKVTGSRMGRLWVVLAVLWWVGIGAFCWVVVSDELSMMTATIPTLDQCVLNQERACERSKNQPQEEGQSSTDRATNESFAEWWDRIGPKCITTPHRPYCEGLIAEAETRKADQTFTFWAMVVPFWLLTPFAVLLVTWGSYRVVRWVWKGAGPQ